MGNFNPVAVVSVHPTSIDRPIAGGCSVVSHDTPPPHLRVTPCPARRRM